jgi:hypothetical protein
MFYRQYGDVICCIHYSRLLDFNVRQVATTNIAVRLDEWQHPFGVVETQCIEIVGIEEKPSARTHIKAGV